MPLGALLRTYNAKSSNIFLLASYSVTEFHLEIGLLETNSFSHYQYSHFSHSVILALLCKDLAIKENTEGKRKKTGRSGSVLTKSDMRALRMGKKTQVRGRGQWAAAAVRGQQE